MPWNTEWLNVLFSSNCWNNVVIIVSRIRYLQTFKSLTKCNINELVIGTYKDFVNLAWYKFPIRMPKTLQSRRKWEIFCTLRPLVTKFHIFFKLNLFSAEQYLKHNICKEKTVFKKKYIPSVHRFHKSDKIIQSLSNPKKILKNCPIFFPFYLFMTCDYAIQNFSSLFTIVFSI